MDKNKNSYNHVDIEPKWQNFWLKNKVHFPDKLSQVRKENTFYNLWMFPYPSGEGLHAGHAFSSTGSDVYGRFMRQQGKAVFQPIGYDSFGMHAENFALKTGIHPTVLMEKTTANYARQMKSLGHGYDWTRTLMTSDPLYYRWTQWLFTLIFKSGLAYRKTSLVNFCPSCKTVLADEQVIDEKCERCGTTVIKKELEQWFFRITEYADRLLANLDQLTWSERVKTAQHNWIGKKQGMIISFPKEKGGFIDVFTTRPDTLAGATFLVLASDNQETKETTEKIGRFTGEYVINPLTNKKIPVWEANYVTSSYGTGAIMGVPAEDERDREFALKYNLRIKNITSDNSLQKTIKKNNWGKPKTNYHLRDWLISRQRYWGPPIPMIYCSHCAKKGDSWLTQNSPLINHNQSDWNHAGWWPEENLPITLPNFSDYQPKGEGKGPLSDHPEFFTTTCPFCKSEAKRETDVSDTFLDSSWYFLAYPNLDQEEYQSPSSLNSQHSTVKIASPFNKKILKNWLPVHLYFGGAEHAVLHLMYARFVTMILFDLDLIKFEEPFPRFFAHGLMIKDGAKMSKSRGNVISPDSYIEKYGADTLRLYLLFMGPMDGSPDFRDTGIEGMRKFVNRLWQLLTSEQEKPNSNKNTAETDANIKLHQTIMKVTKDIEKFHYNTAIASLMEYINFLKNNNVIINSEQKIALCQLIAPFAPHLAEEVWVNILKQEPSVHASAWPKFDPSLISTSTIILPVQINGKTRSTIEVPDDQITQKSELIALAKESPKIATNLKNQKIVKEIYVEGKIINFVTSS